MRQFFTSSVIMAIALALPAFAYVHFRAYALSFTYDECWTFLGYASQSVMDIVTNASPAANNHIFHSLWMKAVMPFAGTSEYLLRLPALAAMLLLVVYLFRVSVALLARLWWLPFIVVLYQPYLLDYFGIARGYGMALAFSLAAIERLFAYSDSGNKATFFFSCMFAFLAAYSNFTYLLVAVAIVFALAYTSFKRREISWAWPSLTLLAALAGPAFYFPISQLVKAQELYYGGTDGFYADTLITLANRAIYDLGSGELIAPLFFMLLTVGAAQFGFEVVKGRVSLSGWLAFVAVGISLGSMVQHYVLGSPYLIDRTAMMLLPLFALQVAYWVGRLSLFLSAKWPAGALSLIVVGVFVAAFNLDYQLDFKEHADTEAALLELENHVVDTPPFHLGKSRYMNATIAFYRRKHGLAFLLPPTLSYCDEAGPTDYYYLFETDLGCTKEKGATLIKHFEVSNTYLFKME